MQLTAARGGFWNVSGCRENYLTAELCFGTMVYHCHLALWITILLNCAVNCNGAGCGQLENVLTWLFHLSLCSKNLKSIMPKWNWILSQDNTIVTQMNKTFNKRNLYSINSDNDTSSQPFVYLWPCSFIL